MNDRDIPTNDDRDIWLAVERDIEILFYIYVAFAIAAVLVACWLRG